MAPIGVDMAAAEPVEARVRVAMACPVFLEAALRVIIGINDESGVLHDGDLIDTLADPGFQGAGAVVDELSELS